MTATLSDTTPLVVGDRFVSTDSRPYTDTDGTRGIHETTLLMEVTGLDDRGFTYKRVEILAETGRPSFCLAPATGGTMAWFGWDAALAKGRVRRA